MASSADLAEVVTAGVERDVVLSDYNDDYDKYDDYHTYNDYDEYDNYDDYDEYGDYDDYDGDVIAGVTSMEEYQECHVILSDVVPPQMSRLPSVTLPIHDPPCRASTQLWPLIILLRRFGMQLPS